MIQSLIPVLGTTSHICSISASQQPSSFLIDREAPRLVGVSGLRYFSCFDWSRSGRSDMFAGNVTCGAFVHASSELSTSSFSPSSFCRSSPSEFILSVYRSLLLVVSGCPSYSSCSLLTNSACLQ